MAERLEDFLMTRKPTADRPLLGQTVLVVEDSRFACEAMRLLCLRSGARIRRADSLKSAARHLSTYRPSVVIVDMGLPDGSGCELIKQLAQSTPRVSALLGTSGDDMMADVAMAAGADGFLAKPITSLAAFQEAVLALIPADQRPKGLRRVSDEEIIPDRLALKDDLAHIAEVLDETSDETTLDYVAQFLSGLARSADDSPLEKAAIDLAETRRKGDPTGGNVAYLSGLVQDRLTDHAAV